MGGRWVVGDATTAVKAMLPIRGRHKDVLASVLVDFGFEDVVKLLNRIVKHCTCVFTAYRNAVKPGCLRPYIICCVWNHCVLHDENSGITDLILKESKWGASVLGRELVLERGEGTIKV